MNAKMDMRTAEFVRTATRDILKRDVPRLEEMHEAICGALPEALRDDPAMDHHLRLANKTNAIECPSADVVKPVAPVEPRLEGSIIRGACDVARRGISPAAGMEAFGLGQKVAWQGWVETCLGFANERGELGVPTQRQSSVASGVRPPIGARSAPCGLRVRDRDRQPARSRSARYCESLLKSCEFDRSEQA